MASSAWFTLLSELAGLLLENNETLQLEDGTAIRLESQ